MVEVCWLTGQRRVTGHSDQGRLRIGLDLGGSKIEGILLSREATELARYRIATPREDYFASAKSRHHSGNGFVPGFRAAVRKNGIAPRLSFAILW